MFKNLYYRGFQPMGHGPVVGHSGIFSGPRSINQNKSNMYNICIIRLAVRCGQPREDFVFREHCDFESDSK